MLKRLSYKNFIALSLIFALVTTVFAPVCYAEESEPVMPDLSEYNIITIDEIEPETTVSNIIENTAYTETEEIKVFDNEGYLLSGGDYVGNGSTVIIFDNDTIKEVYKVKLYGDLDCDGEINSADLVEIRGILLNVKTPADDTVADIGADGECNISDLVRLKKHQAEIADISQNRISVYSKRFNWLDSIEVPFEINGYAESFEDFSVLSNDIDLTFSRYYDSNDTYSNMLSHGWTATFEGNCIPYNNNSMIVRIYGQSPVVFNLSDGKYVCDYSRAKLTVVNNEFVFLGEDGLTYKFNQSGYLTSITDKNNNTVSINVDINGKIQKVTDSVGRVYNYTYGENGLLASITDCMERTVNYTYDSSNRLSTVTGVLGTVTEQYEYNSNNKLIRIFDAFENTISEITYEDNSGIVSSVTDSENVTTHYSYNYNNNSITVMQDGEVTEECIYNKYNYLLSSNTTDGLQQNCYCNSYGDVTFTKNADGSKTNYVYDNNGNPVKTTTVSEDETVTETNTYDLSGNLLTCVSNGEEDTYTYDTEGNVLTFIKTVDGETTENTVYTYSDSGLLNTACENGVTTSYIYDNYGYLTSETASDQSVLKNYNYNILGWIESETESETTVNYKYNLNGDVLRETKNDTVINRTVYDNYGRVKQQITQAEYNPDFDGLDSLPENDSYLNGSAEVPVGVRYYYGEDGKLSEIKASCYTVNTDSNQKVTNVIAGNTVLAEYSYTDDANELLSNIDYANGQSISYNYDTQGNIIFLYYGDTLAYSYTYDTENNLTSKTNLAENIKTVYNEDGFVENKINSDGSLTPIHNYNSQLLVKLDLPAGTIGDNCSPALEDEEPDLERITESFGGKTFSTDYYEEFVNYDSLTYYINRDENDKLTDTEFKKGSKNLLKTEYSYDEEDLPEKSINNYDYQKHFYFYGYDSNGNITSITETLGEDYEIASNEIPPNEYIDGVFVTAKYEKRYYYDDAGQLIRVDDEAQNCTTQYIYNGKSGNISAVKTYALREKDAELGTPISTRNFSYAQSGWTDLLTSVDGKALSYDNLGNLISYNGYTYIWEAGRRLTQMTNGTNTYNYKYDDNGIRTEKTINGVTTYYTTVDGRITGQYDGTNTIYFRYDAENSLIGFNLNGTEYIYIKNIQGDIEGILDCNGDLVVEYTYDSWGKLLSVIDTSNINLGTLNPMRYRGYYYDNETGYYYLQSRYYSPEFCRFINADEPSMITLNIDNIVGANLFAYCGNKPVNNVDYFGFWYQEIASISKSKVLDDFLRAIDDYVYDNKNTWYKRLIYGTAKTIIGSVKKYNIGNAYSVVSVVWDSFPKLNDELNTIRYYSDKIKNKYFSSAYRYTIFLLFGSHNMQYKLNVLKRDHVISTTIIEFRVNGVYTVLRNILKKLKVKMVKYNVKWKYYYK